MVENGMPLCLLDTVLGNHPQDSNLFVPGHPVPRWRGRKGREEAEFKVPGSD